MIARPTHLRTQVSLAMIFSAIAALAILILGMVGFYIYMQDHWVQGLAPDNRATLESLIANEAIDPDALTTLVSVFSFSWTETYAAQELFAVFSFVVLAIISSVCIGSYIARRLSRPIEVVAKAARTVSHGAFDTEVDVPRGQSHEARDLLTSFNTMTTSLRRAELEANGSAAAIAHELRTPLTILRGRLQGIGDGAFEPNSEMMEALIGQVDTLAAIVDDLGTLTHLTGADGQFETMPIDLADIAHAVITSIKPDLIEAGMKLEVSLLPASAKASPERLRQALNALVQNAIRYAADGGYLKISTGQTASEVYLSVQDKGPGIPEDQQERVFERWWRADTSRSRANGGSGLGLSVVKAIVNAHGGDVKLEAHAEAVGSTFTISLPRL